MSAAGELWLLRHGQTEWSRSGQHTGRTNIPLTAEGERDAARWAPELHGQPFAAVFCSPLLRARRTAELAGLTVTDTVADLQEWHYGDVEGRTTAELRVGHPGWDIWADGPPGGETLPEVADRVDRVLAQAAGPLRDGDVMLVAHGHILRILMARWLEAEPGLGARLTLAPAALAILGYEHERRVVHRLGLTPGSLSR